MQIWKFGKQTSKKGLTKRERFNYKRMVLTHQQFVNQPYHMQSFTEIYLMNR